MARKTVKIQHFNKKTSKICYMISIPKAIVEALNWDKEGTKLQVSLGKDRAVILREHKQNPNQ